MKRFSLLPVSLLLLIILVFFYPIFKGWIPFPGDLVVSTPPYSTQSFLGYAPGGVPNKPKDLMLSGVNALEILCYNEF